MKIHGALKIDPHGGATNIKWSKPIFILHQRLRRRKILNFTPAAISLGSALIGHCLKSALNAHGFHRCWLGFSQVTLRSPRILPKFENLRSIEKRAPWVATMPVLETHCTPNGQHPTPPPEEQRQRGRLKHHFPQMNRTPPPLDDKDRLMMRLSLEHPFPQMNRTPPPTPLKSASSPCEAHGFWPNMKTHEALKIDSHVGAPTTNGQSPFVFYTKGSAGEKF